MSGPPPSDDGVRRTYHRRRGTRKLALAGVAAAAALAWWRWRPFRIEIAGDSMRPTLEAGDWAVAVRARRVRPGDVVVLEHPDRPGFELVKRVVGETVVEPIGPAVWVEGDGERSTDSRSFGAVPQASVRGRVVAIWWPPGRRSLL